MAGSAEPVPNQELDEVRDHRHRLQTAAARLYGQGFTRSEVATMLFDHLAPPPEGRTLEMRKRQVRAKLKRWEASQEFRDLIWELALIKTDLQAPQILGGLVSKAKRGRVDAAKLALELTGRYSSKPDQAPTQVAVVFGGINRPAQDPSVVVAELNGPVEDEE